MGVGTHLQVQIQGVSTWWHWAFSKCVCEELKREGNSSSSGRAVPEGSWASQSWEGPARGDVFVEVEVWWEEEQRRPLVSQPALRDVAVSYSEVTEERCTSPCSDKQLWDLLSKTWRVKLKIIFACLPLSIYTIVEDLNFLSWIF